MANIELRNMSEVLNCQVRDVKAKITNHFFTNQKQNITDSSPGMYQRLTSAISSRKAFVLLNNNELEYKVSPDKTKPFEGLVNALIEKLNKDGDIKGGVLIIVLNDDNKDIKHEDKRVTFSNFNLKSSIKKIVGTIKAIQDKHLQSLRPPDLDKFNSSYSERSIRLEYFNQDDFIKAYTNYSNDLLSKVSSLMHYINWTEEHIFDYDRNQDRFDIHINEYDYSINFTW